MVYSSQGAWWLLSEPAVLIALALLAQGKERMPRCWLWLLGVELAGQTLAWFPIYPLLFLYRALNDLPWVIVAAVVLWAVVDARPAIAVGVAAVLGRTIPLASGWLALATSWSPLATSWYYAQFGGDHAILWPLAWGAMLALLMTFRLRRQAAL